ncbi:MAG: DUF1549 domain-containing protein, partial [Pirellulales bacterium]
MNDEHEPTRHDGADPVLDACLAELMGGQTPPDLSDQILAAWLQRRSQPQIAADSHTVDIHTANGHAAAPTPEVPQPSQDTQPIFASSTPVRLGTSPGVRPEAPVTAELPTNAVPSLAPTVARSSSADTEAPASAAARLEQYQATRSRRRSRMRWLSIAAGLMLVAAGYAAYRNMPQFGDQNLAGNQPGSTDSHSTTPEGKSRKLLSPEERQALDRQIAAANQGITVEELTERERLAQERRDQQAALMAKNAAAKSLPSGDVSVNSDPAIPFPASPTQPGTDTPAPRSNSAGSLASASGDADVIAFINEQIRKQWEAAGVAPSPVATDHEWIRRVFLDILGRIPTADETTRFAADKSKDKRARLVDRLLDSDDYIEEFARNWTTIWTNILIGRNGGTEQNSMVSRAGLQQYLRRAMLSNKPYNDLVHDLVSAKGSNTPGADDFNGATNFIL